MPNRMRPPDALHHLPLYAKCAIEYLDAQAQHERSIAKLDNYLAHYATSMGCEVDEHVRYSAHAIVLRRFSGTGMDFTGSIAKWLIVGSETVVSYLPPASQNLSVGSH